MDRQASSAASSEIPVTSRDDDGARSRLSPLALLLGLVVIAMQLLAFDMLVQQHARRAELQAASYVAASLQPSGGAAAQRAQRTLLAATE